MKKILALVMALALVVCASVAMAEEAKVMTKEEYDAAAIDDEVCVEAYVQAAQGWWMVYALAGVCVVFLKKQKQER